MSTASTTISTMIAMMVSATIMLSFIRYTRDDPITRTYNVTTF
jgi:hypothetical protein